MAFLPLDIDRINGAQSSGGGGLPGVRSPAMVMLYHRLKDARSGARSEERNIVPGEPFRLPGAWMDVRQLAVEALEAAAPDIEVLAWLAEAELRLAGFDGLRRVFALTGRLVRERFDALQSIEGDGLEDKVAPLTGLNGISGEGTLIQPIRLSSLVPGGAFFENTLWDFQMAQRANEEGRRKVLKDAVAAAGHIEMRTHLAVVTACIAAFAELTAALDERCGAEAPASSNIRSVLQDVRLAIVNLAGLEDAGMPTDPATPLAHAPSAPGQALSVAPPVPSEPLGIRSREEALDRLLDVASYFRRHEPQSPLSAAIETAVERGRMDFNALLVELVQDEQVRRNILITAGIRPHSDNSS